MSEKTGSTSELEIVEKILADAESQAQRVIENANRAAEAETEKARKEAQRIQDDILAEAEQKAENLRSRELSTAKIEAKRTLLRAREEAVSKVLGQVETILKGIREDRDRYGRSLANLAVEAVTAVGEPEVVLKVSQADEGVVDNTFIDGVSSRVRELSGDETRIELEFDLEDMGGGCVAKSTQGRVIFDNTFRRRLERMKPQLRAAIIRELDTSDE